MIQKHSERQNSLLAPLSEGQWRAKKRWINLVQWWETKTQRRLWTDETGNQKGVPDDWVLRYHFATADKEIRDVLDHVENYGPYGKGDDRDWARWCTVDAKTIEVRRKLHNKLVKAARDVLEIRQHIEDYAALIFAETYAEYLNRLTVQLPAPDDACWDMVVQPDAWKAAYLLATLENPYPENVTTGPAFNTRNYVKSRRLCIQYLINRTRFSWTRTWDKDPKGGGQERWGRTKGPSVARAGVMVRG